MPSTWPAERGHTVSMGPACSNGITVEEMVAERADLCVTVRYCDSVVTRNVGKQP